MQLDVKTYDLDFWTGLIQSEIPFSLSRWGDGEWGCLLGDEGHNCDRHQYFPELRDDLRRALKANRPYYKGWLAVARHAGPERISEWLDQNDLYIEWVDGDIFLDTLLRGQLASFIQALESRRVLYVGPIHLAKLANLAGWQDAGFVEVPPINAYLEKERILAQIRLKLYEPGRPQVIGFSAGMLSNVLIDELFPRWGQRVTMIDFGSIWDGFFGIKSRSYHKRMDWRWMRHMTFGVA